jgi:hypothetical protein
MKSVNIIGKGKTWVDAPMDGENWGITQLLLRRPVSMVIDMNVYEDRRWGEEELQEAVKVRAMCAEQNIPYVGLRNYPINEVIDRFETDYFASTVDYAIALALFRGYDDIHLYGVTVGSFDYAKLKCGIDFWCGYAKGLGVKITVHGVTTVMKTIDGLVYGYDIPQGEFRAAA